MLTATEQKEVLTKVKKLVRATASARRRASKGEIRPRRAKELIQVAEDELRELLKEIG
jgi:hypothetical protein